MKKAFTLAEVLVTLGIVGVVAAMTLPVLVGKYKEKVTLHKLETAYSQLSSAYAGLITEYGTPDLWEDTTFNGLGIANMFAKKLRLKDICLTSSVRCHTFGDTNHYQSLNGYDIGSSTAIIGTVAKFNDMLVFFRFDASNCRGWSMYGWESVTKKSPYYHSCGTIYVDINGNHKPNRFGVDVFQFIMTDRKIVPTGTPPTPYYNLRTACNPKMTSWDGSLNGSFCTAWLLINKNMDYLRKQVEW